MRVFVTGATGFLGRNLITAMRAAGHDVTGVGSIDCNLLREESLRRFREPYDQIWHLAAWTQAGDFCLHHPGEQWVHNQRINTNVLDWWQTRQPQAKLIAIGTSCSYAPGSDLTEENYLVGAPVPVVSAERFDPARVDAIVLSSQGYEQEMAGICAERWPEVKVCPIWQPLASAADFEAVCYEKIPTGLYKL